MYDLRIGGQPRYANDCVRTAPYNMADPVTADNAGLLVVFTGNAFEMDIAAAGGFVDGVTTFGSRDTAGGIWNIAYASNIDALDVLVVDGEEIFAGSEIYVGAGGRATAVAPAAPYYIVGISAGETKAVTLCDGTEGAVVPVVFEKVRSLVAAAAAPAPTKKIKKDEV